MAETETSASRDRDVDNFSQDETEMRRWYKSRPSRHRDVETETTTLQWLHIQNPLLAYSVYIHQVAPHYILSHIHTPVFHWQLPHAEIICICYGHVNDWVMCRVRLELRSRLGLVLGLRLASGIALKFTFALRTSELYYYTIPVASQLKSIP